MDDIQSWMALVSDDFEELNLSLHNVKDKLVTLEIGSRIYNIKFDQLIMIPIEVSMRGGQQV